MELQMADPDTFDPQDLGRRSEWRRHAASERVSGCLLGQLVDA